MKRVRVAVIPAAGKGYRISPLSKLLPKSIIPIIDKPILELIIQRMIHEFGIEEIYLLVGDLKEPIIEYVKGRENFGIKIKYIDIRNKNSKGIADSIYLLRKKIKEPFLVILGDDFTVGSLEHMTDPLFEKNALAVEAFVKERDISVINRTCCAIINKENKIVKIVEKPIKPISNLRGCGIYLFDKKVFDYIKKMPGGDRGKGITELVDAIARDGKAYGHFIDGLNININTKEELLLANILLARKLEKKNEMDLGKLKWYLKHAHPK